MMKTIVRWSIGIVIGLGAIAALVYAFRQRPIVVEIASASRGPMQVTVDEEGRTRIRERYVVSSPLTGRLRRITLDPGDDVHRDETVLAVIEPMDPELLDARALAEAEARVRAADAAIRRAGADLERARVAHEFAAQEHARTIAASERDAATVSELQEASTAARTTAEELRAAEFAKEIAEYELDVARSALLYATGGDDGERPQMLLHSPIDGAVLRVLQESVAVITPGAPLIEIGDPRDLEIVIDVLSTDAVQITPGDRVIIDHWGGNEPLEAVVRLVEPSAFTKISALGIEEQRVNVIADFVSSPGERITLGDGFRVEANIVIWNASDVLQVPTSAAFRDRNGAWSVFVVANGIVFLRNIQIGGQNGSTTQVVAGLDADESVILHPGDQVEDGSRVSERTPSR